MTRSIRFPHLVLASATAVAACAPGFRYTDMPPLEFEAFDYGFPVRVTSGEPRIAYIDQGSGPTTLLLIHGLAANAGFWRYNIPALAAEYRVVAVDLPGYGHSGKDAAWSYDMTFFAESLSGLIRELRLGPVVVVGHSMGGQIAMTLALSHPDQVRALALLSPAGVESFAPGEGEWLRNTLTIEGIRETPEDGIRRNLSLNFYEWSDEWEWMVEERARMARARDMDWFADAVVKSVGGMLDEPTTGLLGEIRQPVLIVYGEYDHLIPNPYLHPGRTAAVFESAVPVFMDARSRAVPNAGHMVMIERPADVNAAVLEFVRTVR